MVLLMVSNYTVMSNMKSLFSSISFVFLLKPELLYKTEEMLTKDLW